MCQDSGKYILLVKEIRVQQWFLHLRTFGFAMSNEAFAYHSWYFRNALVRANYNNLAKGITATIEYIERFFRNLILGEENELKIGIY